MDGVIGHQLRVASHLIENRYNKKLAEYDLTSAQSRVIYLLNHYGELVQADLQKRLYIQGSTMNGIIETLLKKEFINKKDSKEDRRTKLISITEKGRILEERLWSEVDLIEEDLLKGFSNEEQQLFLVWLNRMKENLQSSEREKQIK